MQQKSRERKKQGLFVLEGLREFHLALKGGYTISKLLYCPEILPSIPKGIMDKADQVIQLEPVVYKKLSYRSSTEGLIGLVRTKPHRLRDLDLGSGRPLLLVAEAPEKPGNIGALLRTADAAGLDAVIIANPKTDLYNPNIIRSSVGCLFSNQVATGNTNEVIDFLKEKEIGIYCAALQASRPYHQIDYTGPSAIVVGTEADGLSQTWLEASDQNTIIPMAGIIDSLNVSVAAGILIFEAKRQRGFS